MLARIRLQGFTTLGLNPRIDDGGSFGSGESLSQLVHLFQHGDHCRVVKPPYAFSRIGCCFYG